MLQGTADTVVDPRNARVLGDRIPTARLETFPGAGHLLFWEQPECFVEVLTAFLQEDSSGLAQRGSAAVRSSSSATRAAWGSNSIV